MTIKSLTMTILVLSLVLTGCAAKTYKLNSSSITPASKGVITGEVDKNQNRILTLKVDYLPLITDLSPELTAFVVWVRRDSNEAYMSQGRMTIDKDRHAELVFKVPYKKMDVLVTAESDPGSAAPSEYLILQGAVELPN